jgi:hypothetical protein
VTSPPNSDSELTELEAVERAFAARLADADADAETEPVVRTDPSLG